MSSQLSISLFFQYANFLLRQVWSHHNRFNEDVTIRVFGVGPYRGDEQSAAVSSTNAKKSGNNAEKAGVADTDNSEECGIAASQRDDDFEKDISNMSIEQLQLMLEEDNKASEKAKAALATKKKEFTKAQKAVTGYTNRAFSIARVMGQKAREQVTDAGQPAERQTPDDDDAEQAPERQAPVDYGKVDIYGVSDDDEPVKRTRKRV